MLLEQRPSDVVHPAPVDDPRARPLAAEGMCRKCGREKATRGYFCGACTAIWRGQFKRDEAKPPLARIAPKAFDDLPDGWPGNTEAERDMREALLASATKRAELVGERIA